MVDSRKTLQLAVRLLANVQNISPNLRRYGRNCQIDFVDVKLIHRFQNAVSAAEHQNPVDESSPFIWIIIDYASRFVVQMFGGIQFSDNHGSAFPGTDYQYVLHLMTLLVFIRS